MVAIQPVLEDIGRKFNIDDVRLPTAVEIEYLKSSMLQQRRLNMQKRPQSSDSEINQNATAPNGLMAIRKAQGGFISRHFREELNVTRFELSSDSIVAQNQVSKQSCISNEQDESLNEKSSAAAELPRNSIVQSSLPPLELFDENNEPTRSVLDQGVSTHSSSTRENDLTGDHVALVPSEMGLGAAFHAQQRETNQSTTKVALVLSSLSKLVTHSSQIWHGFEALILRTEYRRRRERNRCSVLLVRMTRKPWFPRSHYSWMSRDTQLRIKWGIYWSQYFTIFMLGNILLNFLYWIFLFPFVLWVLYRHRDVLERPRTAEELQASIEMLGQLPNRYRDRRLMEQRLLHLMESGSAFC